MYIIKYKQTTSIPGYAIVFQCIKYNFISDSGNMFTSSTYGSSSSYFRTATNAPVYRHWWTIPISENDLNIVVYCINTAWNFATHLLRIIFAELFTSDNLRVYYSYFGGGKLKKRPLDDQRKSAIRRYVIAFYPDVSSDNAYTMQVVTKINECLRRPIQTKINWH